MNPSQLVDITFEVFNSQECEESQHPASSSRRPPRKWLREGAEHAGTLLGPRRGSSRRYGIGPSRTRTFRSARPSGFLDDGVLRGSQAPGELMASRDMVPFPGHPWDTILETIKDQIPSLDSDSSVSDCEEEELFIFQRDQMALIPDLSEELAEDPAYNDVPGSWVATANKSPPESALVSVEFTSEPGSEQKARAQEGGDPQRPFQSPGEPCTLPRLLPDSPQHQKDNTESVSFGTTWPQNSPGGVQGVTPTSLTTEAPSATPLPHRDPAPGGLRALQLEKQLMLERDILHKVTQESQDAACGDHTPAKATPRKDARSAPRPDRFLGGPRAGPPLLSLQQLEEWDLDNILQNLKALEDQGDDVPDPIVPSIDDQLMEQLALQCATQARSWSSVWKFPLNRPQDTENGETCHRRASTKLGLQAAQDQEPTGGRRLKGPAEPPTVFIDLRQTRPPDPPSPPSSSHSSSDSEEDTVIARDQQQDSAEGVPHPSQRLRGCTGKSQLLQQLRAFRKGQAAPKPSACESPVSPKAQAPEEMGMRRKKHVKLWAEGQDILATPSGASPRVLGGPLGPVTAGESLVPPLGHP
ncbi:PREDICTED: uncharacterized protein C16orf71 homolog [Chrysochloris asiatica]|uniref:Dynein axonemal assembly factor 8 n=1 Tax=Chrysochloris asiatica TaxID=185453 RepID=A0A9B0U2W5_CHRAS|nr:PREDICTED: uncharacterized protein C16orf71 homolog [Chrysochloris asiatica]